MKNFIAMSVFILFIGISSALAQQSGGKSTGTSQPTAAPRVEAPVGRRQPRASDLPESATKPYVASPEDKALDRKIKSICRGC